MFNPLNHSDFPSVLSQICSSVFIYLENMNYSNLILLRLLFLNKTRSCDYRYVPSSRRPRFGNPHASLWFAYLLLFFPANLKFMKAETGYLIQNLTVLTPLLLTLMQCWYLEGIHYIFVEWEQKYSTNIYFPFFFKEESDYLL